MRIVIGAFIGWAIGMAVALGIAVVFPWGHNAAVNFLGGIALGFGISQVGLWTGAYVAER